MSPVFTPTVNLCFSLFLISRLIRPVCSHLFVLVWWLGQLANQLHYYCTSGDILSKSFESPWGKGFWSVVSLWKCRLILPGGSCLFIVFVWSSCVGMDCQIRSIFVLCLFVVVVLNTSAWLNWTAHTHTKANSISISIPSITEWLASVLMASTSCLSFASISVPYASVSPASWHYSWCMARLSLSDLSHSTGSQRDAEPDQTRIWRMTPSAYLCLLLALPVILCTITHFKIIYLSVFLACGEWYIR